MLVKVIGIANDIVCNTSTLNINFYIQYRALASNTRMLALMITHILEILTY